MIDPSVGMLSKTSSGTSLMISSILSQIATRPAAGLFTAFVELAISESTAGLSCQYPRAIPSHGLSSGSGNDRGLVSPEPFAQLE